MGNVKVEVERERNDGSVTVNIHEMPSNEVVRVERSGVLRFTDTMDRDHLYSPHYWTHVTLT